MRGSTGRAAEGVIGVPTAWNITIEVEGPRSEANGVEMVGALNDLVQLLEPYDPVAITPALDDSSETVRYGVDLTLEAATLDEAYSWALTTFRDGADKVGLPIWPIVHLEAQTSEELDASLSAPTFPALLGVAELAERLHVSKARASELAHSPTFPPPVVLLASGPIWLESSVSRYLETWSRRPGRPTAAKGPAGRPAPT